MEDPSLSRRARPGPSIVSFLLLATTLALAAAPSSAGPAPEWRIEDRPGDLFLAGLSQAAFPAAAPASHLDLLSVTLRDETEAGLLVTFRVADLHPYRTGFYIFGLQGVDYQELHFEIAGYTPRYSVQVLSYPLPTPPDVPSTSHLFPWARLCVRPAAGGPCHLSALPLETDAEKDELRVWVPKQSLVGQGRTDLLDCAHYSCPTPAVPLPSGLPSKLLSGDRLIRLSASTSGNMRSQGLQTWQDVAPDAGAAPDFVFQQPMANTDVAILLPADRHRAAVEMGETTYVDLPMANRLPFRRVVDLTYELIGPPESVAHFRVQGPPSVGIPAGAARNYTLTVQADPKSLLSAPVHVVVRGQSRASPPELVYADIQLAPTRSLGPDNLRIYFHGHEDPNLGSIQQGPLCDEFGCGPVWMDAISQHPLHDAEVTLGLLGFDFAGNTYHAFDFTTQDPDDALPVPLSTRPIALDPARPIRVDLDLRTDTPGAYQASLRLLGASGKVVAQKQERVALNAGSTTVAADLLPEAEGLLLPAEETAFYFEAVVQPEPSSPGAVAGQGSMRLGLRASGIQLPLVALPENFETGTPGAPLRLRPVSEATGFVNPLEARLFNLTLANVGDRPDTAHVAASVDAPEWTVDVLPGTTYRLDVGDTVALGVLVRAPAQAREGETAIVRLNASTEGQPEHRGFLRLDLISITGVDVPDDAQAFRLEEDTAQRIVPASGLGKAPGPPAWALWLAALAWMVAARRRKG